MGGYRREFDRSMEGIEAKVIELFAIVAEDLPAATQALLGTGEMVRDYQRLGAHAVNITRRITYLSGRR